MAKRLAQQEEKGLLATMSKADRKAYMLYKATDNLASVQKIVIKAGAIINI